MLSNRRPQSRYRQNGVGERQKEDESDLAKARKMKVRSNATFRSVALLRQRLAARLNRERRWKLVIMFLVSTFIIFKSILIPLEIKYFGNRYEMEGGKLGAKLDRRSRRFHRRRIEKRRRERLEELGILLPPLDDARNEKYLTITSEILQRRAERKRALTIADFDVKKRIAQCQSPSASFKLSNVTAIPRYILQPNYGSWFRPRRDEQLTVIPFEEHDMTLLVGQEHPSLLHVYETSDVECRLLLWSLCALYKYGGFVFGKGADQVEELVDEAKESQNVCDNFASIMVTRKSSTNGTLDFVMLAASPRHPMLKCAIDRLGALSNATNAGDVLQSLYSSRSWDSSIIRTALAEHDDKPATTSWEVLSLECSTLGPASFCDGVDLCASDQDGRRKTRMYVKLVDPNGVDNRRSIGDGYPDGTTSSHTDVTITEWPGTPPPEKSHKVSVRDWMKESKCDAGWRCNRCLHNPVYGSYESCEAVCSDCFIDHICDERNSSPPQRTVTFDVVVRHHGRRSSQEQLIPRIVHQTWWEDLSVDRYPQLLRAQSSWKNVGYEYRFYTDVEARNYIAENFPTRFLDAYDSLVPGAFKADLFRLLVLLKEGGIYADVDVLAGANLNAFITPTMSFFAPLDLVGADYDEEFCLWNGIIGSAPGHPILAEAVQWLVTMILNRADEYDFERELCRTSDKKLPVWKVRQGRLLLLSGPCALGVAANRARGQADPVSRIDSGWLTFEGDNASIGDSLILRGDKFDMNAFRFTDVDRNIIVASTDMIDLTSTPLASKHKGALRKSLHYSEIEAMDDLFGARGVYVDDLVVNEDIRLEVLYRGA